MKQNQDQPFARDQAKPFVAGPFLGGYIIITAVAVAANGALTLAHALGVPPRHVEVLVSPGNFPSRVYLSTSTAASVVVQFNQAQPAGTVLWLW